MELRQIRYFVEVARLSHFTRAAERLRVAQPSLSQQIRSLEAELGEKLFERTSRRVRLTAAGEAFLARAERILAEVEGAKEELEQFSGPSLRGWVRVGALPSVAGTRLPALLASFGALHPGVAVSSREGSTKEMLGLLRAGDVDLALAHSSGRGAPPGMIVEELFSEDLVLMLSSDHALATRESVGLGELREEDFVTFEEGVGLRLRLEEACLAEGFSPRVRYESRSLRAFAAEGLGVAIVPRCMAEGEGPAVAAVGLGPPPLVRTVATFRIARRHFSSAATAFLSFVGEHL